MLRWAAASRRVPGRGGVSCRRGATRSARRGRSRPPCGRDHAEALPPSLPTTASETFGRSRRAKRCVLEDGDPLAVGREHGARLDPVGGDVNRRMPEPSARMRKRSPSKGRRQQSPSCPSVANATADRRARRRPTPPRPRPSCRRARRGRGAPLGRTSASVTVRRRSPRRRRLREDLVEGPTVTTRTLSRPLVDALPPEDAARTAAASTSDAIRASGSSRAPVADEVLLAGVRVAQREPPRRRAATERASAGGVEVRRLRDRHLVRETPVVPGGQDVADGKSPNVAGCPKPALDRAGRGLRIAVGGFRIRPHLTHRQELSDPRPRRR